MTVHVHVTNVDLTGFMHVLWGMHTCIWNTFRYATYQDQKRACQTQHPPWHHCRRRPHHSHHHRCSWYLSANRESPLRPPWAEDPFSDSGGSPVFLTKENSVPPFVMSMERTHMETVTSERGKLSMVPDVTAPSANFVNSKPADASSDVLLIADALAP